MGLSETLGGIYSALEDKFFAVADFLDSKGLPVYGVIDALEQKGIPAFPVFTAALLMITGLVGGLAFVGTSYDVQLTTNFVDQFSQPVSQVNVVVKDDAGHNFALDNSVLRNGDTVTLKGVPIGATLTVVGSKDGYLSGSGDVKVTDKSVSVAVQLQRQLKTILGKALLVDAQTRDKIKNAKVVAQLKTGEEIACTVDANGAVSCLGVPEGEDVQLKVYADNYEEKDFTLQFSADSASELQLPPKASATIGLSNVILRVFDADAKTLVPHISVKVYDTKDGQLILDDKDDDGEYFTKIAKGTSVRYVVSADGYITYDSSVELTSKTLRDDTEVVEVDLRKGGASIHVTVVAQDSSLVLSNATVELYNQQGERIDSGVTQFGGDVFFRNIDALQQYYVTASADRYLPARVDVDAQKQTEYSVALPRAASDNSTTLTVFVTDSKGDAANDTVLDFYETVNGADVPLGVPQDRTDITGYAKATVPVGKAIKVRAVKDNEKGEASLTTNAKAENRLEVYLANDKGVFSLSLVDGKGNPLTAGNIIVASTSGTTLFSGPVTTGTVYFNPAGLKTAKVSYTGRDGALFEEEIFLDGKNQLQVTIGQQSVTGLAPQVEFQGIEDPNGAKADGMVKGQDYYAVFKTTWPDGQYDGGMHFRFGPDEVRFADSADVGIIGFSGFAPKFAYGRSYTPEPNPGFEGIDLRNRGLPGEYNRWLELYNTGGAGERVYKVRVKAKETATGSTYPLFYRAWTRIGSAYYRVPIDPVMQGLEYAPQRTGLYAETQRVDIKVFDAKPTCKDTFCATYRFLAEDGTQYDSTAFSAVEGGLYALEIEVAPSKELTATVRGSTSKSNPQLFFTGYGVEQFADFPDKNSTDTDIEAKDVKITPDKPLKVRLYFRAAAKGNAALTVQLVAAEGAITQNFNFGISKDAGIAATVTPDRILVGQDFTILLKGDDGSLVENATIQFFPSTNAGPSRTINGSGTVNRGLNGLYQVKNNFPAGTIRFTAKAPGYRPFEGFVEVGREGVLTAPQSAELNIPKGQKSADVKFDLKNTSADRVQDLTVEIAKVGDFPDGLDLRVTPPNTVEPNVSAKVTVVGEYTGAADHAHGEADVIFRGRVFGKFKVEAQTRVVLDYNRPLDPNCVEFSTARLVSFLLTEAASNQTIQVTARNKCPVGIELQSSVVPVSGTALDDSLKIVAENIVLGAAGTQNDTKTFNVSVVNELVRNYAERQNRQYNLLFTSDLLTKSLPLQVVLWNKDFALQVTRNIDVYLADTGQGEAKVTVPIYATNAGYADIQNLSFSVGGALRSGNAKVEIEPKFPVSILRQGQQLVPPYFVVVTAQRNEKTTPLDVQEIGVKGIINGKTYDFGPILVTVHISPKQCVTVAPDYVEFRSARSKEGALSQELTVKNECAEEVRVRDIEPKGIGANRLDITGRDLVILPGASAKINLALTKSEDYHTVSPVPGFLRLLLVRSGKFSTSNPFNIQVDLGKVATLRGVAATDPIRVPVCENEKTYQYISFPKIAKQGECDKAYCDAEQLADFLAQHIRDKVKDAQRQITIHYKNEVANSNCQADNQALNQGYCMFEFLGLKPDSFDVYFTNDQLDAEMLRDAFGRKAPELSAYNVQIGTFSEDQFKAGQGTGYGKQIFITDSFRGCGLYHVRLTGAVPVQGGRMLPDFSNVLVDLKSGLEEGAPIRETTEQCANVIQNAMAFLPLDKSYSPENSRNSLLGVVSTDEEKLQSLAGDFAQALFNSNKRVSGSTGNHVELSLGDTQGYTLKLSMQKAGDPGDPRTIQALVHRFEEGTDQTKSKVQKDILASAGKAIREIAERQIDGCMTEDQSEFRVKSTQKLGEITVAACANPLTVSQKTNCCDYNVLSDVSEPVRLSVRKESEFQGLADYFVQGEASKNKTVQLNPQAQVKLDRVDAKGRYYKTLAVCALGDKLVQFSQGKKLLLGAQSAVFAQKQAKEDAVNLQVCGIHPFDLMDRVSKEPLDDGQTKTFYATTVWSGEPSSILLSDLKKLEDAKTRLDDATKILANAPAEGQTSYDKKFRTQKLIGIGAFVAGCSLSKLIPGLQLTWIFDCGIPALLAVADEFGIIKPVTDAVGSFGKSAFNSAKHVTGLGTPDEDVNAVTRLIAGAADLKSGSKDEEQLKAQTQNLLIGGGLAGSTAKVVVPATLGKLKVLLETGSKKIGGAANPTVIKEGAQAVGQTATEVIIPELAKPLTKSSARSVATQYAEAIANNIVAERWNLAGANALPNAARKSITNELRDQITDNLYSKIFRPGVSITPADLQAAGIKSYSEVAPGIFASPRFTAPAYTLALRPEMQETLTNASEAVAKEFTEGSAQAASTSLAGTEGYDTASFFQKKIAGAKRGGIEEMRFKTASATPIVEGDAEKLAQKAVEELEKKYGGWPAGLNQTAFETNLSNELKPQLLAEVQRANGGKIAAERLTSLVEGGLEERLARASATPGLSIQARYFDPMPKFTQTYAAKTAVIEGEAEKLFNNAMTDIAKNPGARTGGVKSFMAEWLAKKPAQFFGKLAWGVGSGLVAQTLGLLAWNIYWKAFADPIAPTEAISAADTVKKPDGTVLHSAVGDLEFQKNETYKVTLTRHGDKKDIKFEHVTDLASVEADKKLDDCTGKAYEKDVLKVLHNLRPDASAWGEQGKKEAKYVKAYYESVGVYSTSAAKNTGVPEALLVTLGIWESGLGLNTNDSFITGCGKPDPKWKGVADSFQCAATELKPLLAACPGDAQQAFTCTVQAYAKKYPAAEKPDLGALYDTYTRWNATQAA